MATEFLVKPGIGSLEVHALAEHETIPGLTIPVPVLNLRDEAYRHESGNARSTHTAYGEAVLIDTIGLHSIVFVLPETGETITTVTHDQTEPVIPLPVDTTTAAQAVLEFFTKRSEVSYYIHDQYAGHIDDDFLHDMPPEFVRKIRRLRNPDVQIGMYL